MKKIKSILNIKLLLAIAFMGVSALGFSQTTDANFEGGENSKEVRFDFMGTDLLTQSPPQLNGWKHLSESNQNPALKSAEFSHSRLDSIHGMINYGIYIENWDWQFNYDENNKLTTSLRQFRDDFDISRNKTELHKYDENGQTKSVVRTERQYLKEDFVTSYQENNEYANGNLMKQIKVEVLLDNIGPSSSQAPNTTVTTETTFSYNEKDQLTRSIAVSTQENRTPKIISNTTEYLYDQEGRKTYKIQFKQNANFASTPYKYEYTILDNTLIIYEKQGYGAEYRTPDDLAKFVWYDYMTYRISLDQDGRTKSIEKTVTINGYIALKVDYDYTPSGKQKQATFYLAEDPYNPATYYASTIFKNTYDEQDNLLQYEKMFYNSVLNKWVHEELKTYYYSSVKNVLTSNHQHKTDNLHIYPNPASEVIHLSASPESGTSYIIYNSMGKTVSQGLLKSQSIQISQLKPGIYFLKTIGTNAVSSFRFIKK